MHAQAQTGWCLQQMKNHARAPSCILAVTYVRICIFKACLRSLCDPLFFNNFQYEHTRINVTGFAKTDRIVKTAEIQFTV